MTSQEHVLSRSIIFENWNGIESGVGVQKIRLVISGVTFSSCQTMPKLSLLRAIQFMH